MPKASVTKAEVPSSLKVEEKKDFSIAAHLDQGETRLTVGIANNTGNPDVMHLVVDGEDMTVEPGRIEWWYYKSSVTPCKTAAVPGRIYFPTEGEYSVLVLAGYFEAGRAHATDKRKTTVTVEAKEGILAAIPTWGWVAGGVVAAGIGVGLVMKKARPRLRLPRRRAYPPYPPYPARR